MMGSRESVLVELYAFDVLSGGSRELVGQPWEQRRSVLEDLELDLKTDGLVRPVVYSADGVAMQQAGSKVGAEGTVSKQRRSTYRPGRS